MDLEQLIQEEKEIISKLNENREKQKELSKIEFIQKNGINIGDNVRFKGNGGKEQTGVVSGVYFIGTKAFYYNAILYNSDGKLGKREVAIYSSISKI